MSDYSHLPLGKNSVYSDQYDPTLLQTLPRQLQRDPLNIIDQYLPFHGEDLWNLYELSWLNQNKVPQVAIGEVRIDATSTYLIESKSFKLYLNSLNQTSFDNWEQVKQLLLADLSRCTHGKVQIKLFPLSYFEKQGIKRLNGHCIDNNTCYVDIKSYSPNPKLLTVIGSDILVEEKIVSHLFRSLCPVTQQPDWCSIKIHYIGYPIEHNSLLRYLISFRNHRAFHEQCVEQIFCELKYHCNPKKLTVLARYTRRGGLDINPFRSNWQNNPTNERLARQ